MSHFEDIYEIAADNYGLITTGEARKAGITGTELSRWVKNGRLIRRGSGVYRLTHYIPTDMDKFAEAVALVGPDSFLFGESVLAKEGLGLVNPPTLTIGTPRRVRRKLPAWIKPVQVEITEITTYDGIPSQSLSEAIQECRSRVMPSRLADATEEAWKRGLLTRESYDNLRRELNAETPE